MQSKKFVPEPISSFERNRLHNFICIALSGAIGLNNMVSTTTWLPTISCSSFNFKVIDSLVLTSSRY